MPKNPIIDALKDKTFKRNSVPPTSLTSLNKAYDNLMSLDDHIIKLVVENCAMDALLHNLRIMIEPPSAQCFEGSGQTYAGNFSLGTRVITIVDFGDFHSYSTLMIHEMTHAVSALAFRFDTLRFELEYKTDPQNSQFLKYLDTPPLPCTTSEQRHQNWDLFRYRDDVLSQFKFHNQTTNPADLKFKRCVREDSEHCRQDICKKSGVERLDNFFEDLELLFPKGILETEPLCEVLSIYMECRVKLFKLVKENKMTKEQALGHLAEKLPRIHDYVETDFKKTLQLRLESYYSTLHFQNYEVQCVQLYRKPMSSNQKVGTLFNRDGSLRISTAAPMENAKNEFLTNGTVNGHKIELNTGIIQNKM